MANLDRIGYTRWIDYQTQIPIKHTKRVGTNRTKKVVFLFWRNKMFSTITSFGQIKRNKTIGYEYKYLTKFRAFYNWTNVCFFQSVGSLLSDYVWVNGWTIAIIIIRLFNNKNSYSETLPLQGPAREIRILFDFLSRIWKLKHYDCQCTVQKLSL